MTCKLNKDGRGYCPSSQSEKKSQNLKSQNHLLSIQSYADITFIQLCISIQKKFELRKLFYKSIN